MSFTTWLPFNDHPDLNADSIHVFQFQLQADDSEIERLRCVLSPDELARADRFKIDRARRQFIICRAGLRRILGTFTSVPPAAIEFKLGPYGKPSLRMPLDSSSPIEFSVSHSADRALIAIARSRQLGVDLEQLDDSVRILKLASRFFSPREAAELRGLPEGDQLAGFFRAWTCKEAYLKATGFGLSFPLDKFSVSLNPHEPARLCEVIDQPTELTRWRLRTLDAAPGFAAAILFEAAELDDVAIHQWTLNLLE